jgi:hypothetical protein
MIKTSTEPPLVRRCHSLMLYLLQKEKKNVAFYAQNELWEEEKRGYLK